MCDKNAPVLTCGPYRWFQLPAQQYNLELAAHTEPFLPTMPQRPSSALLKKQLQCFAAWEAACPSCGRSCASTVSSTICHNCLTMPQLSLFEFCKNPAKGAAANEDCRTENAMCEHGEVIGWACHTFCYALTTTLWPGANRLAKIMRHYPGGWLC